MRWTRTGLWLLSPLASLFTAAGDDAVVSVSVGETLTEPEPKAVTEQKVEAVLHNRPLVRSSFVLISQIY